jgi:non-ribosomal peptide synthetase component F/thioesterase domain-containing protein/acyl carrier protein
MKNIRSIVPLLPAQQLMLAASIKNERETYIQQLLFEVNGHSYDDIFIAIEKLIQGYECFRSIILYEGLKQPVWVCKDDIKPFFIKHSKTISELHQFIDSIRVKGFDFQSEPCLRFDWIETENKFYLCITNHHILYDGWGKQQILSDFVKLLKVPSTFLPEKLSKEWYEAWTRLDQKKALLEYKSYLLNFEDYASISQIATGENRSHSYTVQLPSITIQNLSKELSLTGAEVVNFCWSIFSAVWTQNGRVQYAVVKQNGLIEQVKNGFGMGIQTLPFQFEVNFQLTCKEQLSHFRNRERSIVEAIGVNALDPIFSNLNYSFLIAFENYPMEVGLKSVENEFRLEYAYDRSEFPLSLAITPYIETYDFEWHFNTKYHSKEQIECLANQFLNFISSFNCYFNETPNRLIQDLFRNKETQSELNFDINSFLQQLKNNLNEVQIKVFDFASSYFNQGVNRIWLYGDKHENTIPIICAAWCLGVEVVSINEKETSNFIENLRELKQPDIIFSSANDHRFVNAIRMNHIDDLVDVQIRSKQEKNNVALSICTSGTTGVPKVVQLSIQNICTFFLAWESKIPWRDKEVFAVIAHPAFDIGIAELMFPLWKGWKSILIQSSTLSDTNLLRDIMEPVTAFHMVPSLLESWIDATEADNKHRIVMTGGDKVPSHIQLKLHSKFSNARLFQFYGPSECSVLASGFENFGQYETHTFPLGDKFKHANLMLFGSQNEQIALYQEGEIIVVGQAVGLGYANSDTTEKFFVYNKDNAFRTGDFGYLNESGMLFFRGRKDSQIKINGQRIDLSRIESALVQWSSIEHWVVLFSNNCIYAVSKSKKSTQSLDRELLSQWLPFYAIPQFIHTIDEFPLNKNGKVDNKQLLDILDLSIKESDKDEVLDSEIERLIVELFPTVKFNFSLGWYANGLNSIDALKLSGMFKTKLKKNIDINKILSIQNFYDFQKNKSVDIENTDDRELIQIGKEVYSTAARLLFLSESDEQFFKSYWISSGVILPKDITEEKIYTWITSQSRLNLGVISEGTSYKWKKGELQFISLQVDSQKDFEKNVEDKFCPIEASLFMTFFGTCSDQNFLAFKIHHALIDGLGIERVWEALLNDIQSGQINEIKLVVPKEKEIKTDFWKSYLNDVSVKKLPFERKNHKEVGGARINFTLNQEERRRINLIGATYNCSLFEAGLVLFSTMWHRLYKDTNQAIGIPVTIGEYSDNNLISAMSVNILPFKTETADPVELLKSWRLIFNERFTPFSKIAQLDKNQKNGQPFFNCTYLYHSNKEGDKGFETLLFNRSHTDYFIALDFIENESDFIFSWEYRTDLFTEASISKLHSTLFSDSIAVELKSYNPVTSIKILWENVLAKNANNKALYVNDKMFTYTEINQRIIDYGKTYNGSNNINVLLLDRNEEAIVALLYHLIHGIPFIPVDAETSEERISQIKSLASHSNLLVGEAKQLQYAIATSGTTGVPKLVGVTRKGYESAIEAWKSDYHMSASDCCLQAASFSFDVSLGDIGRCFFNGASMVLLSASERKDPVCILQKINNYGVTVFETTPLIVRWWLSDGLLLAKFRSLRLLIVGSDSWKMSEIRLLNEMKHNSLRIISSYGLSETTIDNSFFDCSCDDRLEYSNEMIVPIGKSMPHCQIRITDQNGSPLSHGIEGFISITGPAVGLGYFIDGNWSNTKGNTWISADRGIEDEWGNFHFKGRADRQVKIRGQRVELEEIENIISYECPRPIWKIVDFEQDFSVEMAAFYCGDLTSVEIQQLKRGITGKYPAYYLPTLFLKMDTIPLNSNGKTDLVYLRKYAASKLELNNSISDDKEINERLLSNYEQCFKESILVEQNFFHNGKNSFDAMFFVRNWNKNSDLKIAVHQLFSAENFIQLGQLIMYNESEKELVSGPKLISKAQEAIWFHVKNGNSTLFNLPHFIQIPKSYSLEKVRDAFEQALKMCSALFVKFDESEFGDVYEHTISVNDYRLPTIQLDSLEKYSDDAFIKNINLIEGPAFEAAIITCGNLNYMYFNPHHIVYDGGSDSYLSYLFSEIYFNQKPSVSKENTRVVSQSDVDWSSYFNIDKLPELYFHQPDTSLQPLLTRSCTAIEFGYIKELTKRVQATQTTIIAYLLSRSLHLSGIKINWISLAVDHRMFECVGMHMRAYPFPGYSEKSDFCNTIAKQKWALSQLFAAENKAVIYPKNIAIDAFRQVGLIIQHPFTLDDQEVLPSKQVFTRPRLPISLYVEEINEKLLFRWEFDHSQVSIEQISEIHDRFFSTAKELLKEPVSIINYSATLSDTKFAEESIVVKKELKQIWNRYVEHGKGAYSHFFEAGANSIKALLMLREIDKKLNVKISASEFFKVPTLSFLNDALNKNVKEDLIWEIKSEKSEKELWLLPPIMGYGLIYNSFISPNNCSVVAFNYPDSIGVSSCSTIEEVAQFLINERLKSHQLPKEIVLIGYSMGALVAFELAKLLQEKKCEVKRLIVLDKVAQPEVGNVIDNIELNAELREIALQISTEQKDKERISIFLKKHVQMIEAYQQKSQINCEIEVHYCEKILDKTDFATWQLFSNHQVNYIPIPNASHYEIPKIWNNLHFNFE